MPDVIAETLADTLADPTVTAIGTALAVAAVALWLAAAWWAYADAGRRTDSTLAALISAGWIIVSTPLMLPFAITVYTLARPQQTAAEGRTRRLAAELVDQIDESAPGGCPACGSPTDASWLRCPSCATWLSSPCAACGEWSAPTLGACPFCGSDERSAPSVELLEPVAASARAARRTRRQLRPTGPGRVQRGVGRRPLGTPETRPLTSARSR
jgi:hypothetical protein